MLTGGQLKQKRGAVCRRQGLYVPVALIGKGIGGQLGKRNAAVDGDRPGGGQSVAVGLLYAQPDGIQSALFHPETPARRLAAVFPVCAAEYVQHAGLLLGYGGGVAVILAGERLAGLPYRLRFRLHTEGRRKRSGLGGKALPVCGIVGYRFGGQHAERVHGHGAVDIQKAQCVLSARQSKGQRLAVQPPAVVKAGGDRLGELCLRRLDLVPEAVDGRLAGVRPVTVQVQLLRLLKGGFSVDQQAAGDIADLVGRRGVGDLQLIQPVGCRRKGPFRPRLLCPDERAVGVGGTGGKTGCAAG